MKPGPSPKFGTDPTLQAMVRRASLDGATEVVTVPKKDATKTAGPSDTDHHDDARAMFDGDRTRGKAPVATSHKIVAGAGVGQTTSVLGALMAQKTLAKGTPVKFTEHDFMYGRDTGIQKPRSHFRKWVKAETAKAGAGVWQGPNENPYKIDCLTNGMGPSAPVPVKTTLGGRPVPVDGSPTETGALPKSWQSHAKMIRGTEMRAEDKAEFSEWLSHHPRYSPELSADSSQWNKRFNRTSKAGLEWALTEKGYNVHFVVSKDDDLDAMVKGSSGVAGHQPFVAQYQDGREIEEKRITHAELRWLYRNRENPNVQANVQFWEFSPNASEQFKPVDPPWVTQPDVFRPYGEHLARKGSARKSAKHPPNARPVAAKTPTKTFAFDGGALARPE